MLHRTIIENIIPAIAYALNRRKIFKKLWAPDCDNPDLVKYRSLDSEILNRRLKEEHERAVKIDEKTFKFTLGLSVSLTIIAAASGSFAKFLPVEGLGGVISIICSIAALYMLSAGIISLGALKTLLTFGYGTHHEVEFKANGAEYLSLALLRQEKVNIIRQLRNEAAYQSLRNGFFVLFVALILSVVVLLRSVLCDEIVDASTEVSAESVGVEVSSADSADAKVISNNVRDVR